MNEYRALGQPCPECGQVFREGDTAKVYVLGPVLLQARPGSCHLCLRDLKRRWYWPFRRR